MSEALGLLAACLSSLLGGSAVAATRWSVAGIEPLTLAALRYGIAALCLAPLAVRATRRLRSPQDAAAAIALALLFFALFPWLFTLSLAHTTAARGSLALTTLPLLTYALSVMLGREAPSRRRLAGIALAMAGVALGLSSRLAGGGLTGDLLMVAAAAVGAAYNVLSKPIIQRLGALPFTGLGLAIGAAALIAADPGIGAATQLPGTQWMAVLYLGVVGCALTFALWSVGLQYAPPALVALTVALNPIASAALAALMLGEPVTPGMAAGFMLVVAGLVVASGLGFRRPAVP
ncbi:DMT family transporter [Plastoroseomonas hellenica]|uniref:DMT family transporter n=1 Tax=Plastoroseomonas hellenica TaxID=2687306 RepID=UPI001BA966FF|nr:DMT family transporter [Plastoroseomonas hellenica]MBR0642903.1 DMT family transporter [Plastoroseomonas hellenica]